MKNLKIFTLSLWTLNVLFIIYYLILNYYNRLSQDDYAFLTWSASNNIYDAVKFIYLTHQGRYASFVFQWLKFRFIGLTGIFFFEPIINYLIGLFAIYLIVDKVVKMNKLAISILMMNLFIIVNFEFCSFYWICASAGICSFAFVVFLAYCILFFKSNIRSFVGLVLLSIYIGGSNEAFSPLVLFLMFAYGCYILWQNKFDFKRTFSDKYIIRLCVSAVIILVGFYFVCAAPGNANRLAHYEQPTVGGALLISLKNVILFFYLLFFKLHYIILGSIISFAFGSLYHKKEIVVSKTMFLYSTMIVLIFVWINTIPAAWAMGGFGFHRIYTFAIQVLFFYCLFWAFILGQKDIQSNIIPKVIPCINILVFVYCIVQLSNIFIDAPTAIKYYRSDKDRIEILLSEKSKGRTEPLYLVPLYNPESFNMKSVILNFISGNDKRPVLYYSNEIDTTIKDDKFETGFNNKCLMSYFNLPFTIYKLSE